MDGEIKDNFKIIHRYIDTIYNYCYMENFLVLNKFWKLCDYIMTIVCLNINISLKPFKRNINCFNVKFTSILSNNSVKYKSTE